MRKRQPMIKLLKEILALLLLVPLLAFAQAPAAHGGSGAVLVLLKA